MTKPITAVAVSGGVDSLYALAFLRERGESVFALHARMLPPDLTPIGYEAMLKRLGSTCEQIGVPLHVGDCVEAFTSSVIRPFIHAYSQGQTPNPCARCNAAVKFGILLDLAFALGANRMATGHYIGLEHKDTGVALYAGENQNKDQSYFLSLVPLDRLSRAVAPLALVAKDDVRVFLAARGLEAPAPRESQEICFIPDDDYRAFLVARAPGAGIALPGPGPVILPDGTRIAIHNGLWQYTEGQRRGLGIAWKEPLYVLAKDFVSNILVVGNAAALQGVTVHAAELNFLVPFTDWPETVHIRTRFRQRARPAKAKVKGGKLLLTEDVPSGPYACGQIAAVYAMERHNDRERLRVLGGGVITT